MALRPGDPPAAAVDALYAGVLSKGESQRGQRELLEAAPPDEQVLIAVLRRATPIAFLEAVASIRTWSERPRVLARVVLNPKAPRSLSLRLVPTLYWRDLADVAASAHVPAAVRVRAESLLRDQIDDMRLGDRTTLARIATPAVLPPLLLDADKRVAESALQNPRLREEDLTAALRGEEVAPALVEAVAASPRWSTQYAVRLALVLQPRTPLPIALLQMSSLVPRDLRRIVETPGLRPLLAAAARRVLEEV